MRLQQSSRTASLGSLAILVPLLAIGTLIGVRPGLGQVATRVPLGIEGTIPLRPRPTPVANGAVITPRVWNDCPTSTLKIVNRFPARIRFDEAQLTSGSWANLHVWDLSPDEGHHPMVLENREAFRFGTTLVIDGTDIFGGEAGLRVSPYFSPLVDGRLNVRLWDGEIAAFGGVLPFFSFTSDYGITYSAGQPIYLEITYLPHSNSSDDPATIEYRCIWQGSTYSSGPLPFIACWWGWPWPSIDGSDPVTDCWGIGHDARVGGYSQNRVTYEGEPNSQLSATFIGILWNKSPGRPWNLDYALTPTGDPTATPLANKQTQLEVLGAQPVRGAARVALTLARESDVSLQLYDIAGRRVATMVAGGQSAGRHELWFDTSSLRAGMYLLRLTADGVTINRRMIIAR